MFARFFDDLNSLFSFLSRLSRVPRPHCHVTGALKRHGVIRGFVSPTERGIRAWRIYCNPRRGGCGHAPSLRDKRASHPKKGVSMQRISVYLKLRVLGAIETATDTLVSCLRSAFYKRGVPDTLYVDNGAIYTCAEINQICARVGTLLCHTPVRDGAAKGKIERFFRGVRLRFLDPMDANDELFFFFEETRAVRKDNTFQLGSIRFEAPRDLSARTIHVRHRRGQPGRVI